MSFIQEKTVLLSAALTAIAAVGILAWHNQATAYSFVVAGHTYGHHLTKSVGLHPPFLEKIRSYTKASDLFTVLTGDIVRRPSSAAWTAAKEDMSHLPGTTYLVMGNHDISLAAFNLYSELFGDTFYHFRHGDELYLVLDTQTPAGHVPQDQLEMIKTALKANQDTRTVFIFLHELLWVIGEPRYESVAFNRPAGYKFDTNFWTELVPLLQEFPDQQMVIIAGDLGGRTGAQAAFYDTLENITLIATGMGSIEEENYLRVHITKGGATKFELVPLRDGVTLPPIEHYTVR